MRQTQRVVLASLNRHKLDEFRAILAAYPDVELVPAEAILRNAGSLKFVETHDSYLENCVAKARLVNHGCHYPVLADDSGLEALALDGRPGVRSHRYATARPGVPQDKANIELLLKEVGNGPREARFVCTLALLVEGLLIHATGTLEGTLIDAPRGANGFGYDPIFVPKGSSKTFAEMTDGEKNGISHRARALHELMGKVKNLGLVLVRP